MCVYTHIIKDVHILLGVPGSLDGKESACNSGDPESGRSPGEENDCPLQYSCLENSMDRGAWWAKVHGVTKSQTQLSEHVGRYKRVKVKFLKKGLNNLSAINFIFKRQKL